MSNLDNEHYSALFWGAVGGGVFVIGILLGVAAAEIGSHGIPEDTDDTFIGTGGSKIRPITGGPGTEPCPDEPPFPKDCEYRDIWSPGPPTEDEARRK